MTSKCKCGNGSQVIETRRRPHYIWRRRQCTHCKKTWTTAEIPFAEMGAVKKLNEIKRLVTQ